LQPPELAGMFEQRMPPIADQIGRRLVPRVQEKDALMQELDLAQGSLLVLGGHELAQHLVVVIEGRMAAPVLAQRAQEGLELLHGAIALVEALSSGHGLQRAQDGQRPVAQSRAVGPRHPQHVADQLDGQGEGIVGDEVHPALALRAVEHAIDQADDAGP